jgi:Fe-S-cluster containining protein
MDMEMKIKKRTMKPVEAIRLSLFAKRRSSKTDNTSGFRNETEGDRGGVYKIRPMRFSIYPNAAISSSEEQEGDYEQELKWRNLIMEQASQYPNGEAKIKEIDETARNDG